MLRKRLTTASMLLVLPVAAACTAAAQEDSTTSTSTPTSSTTTGTGSLAAGTPPDCGQLGTGPGQSVDPSSVTTEEELVALIQDAYGEGSLDLHRGHQPVQDVLDEVLGIGHEELHVRMEEQGQNLAAVAEDIGVDPQTLIDALVDSWSPAIDNLLDGTITQAEAEEYQVALEEAFTFRVTWDGEEETPTFSGLDT